MQNLDIHVSIFINSLPFAGCEVIFILVNNFWSDEGKDEETQPERTPALRSKEWRESRTDQKKEADKAKARERFEEICNKHLISHLNFRADARVQKFRARARKYKTEINQLRTKLQ